MKVLKKISAAILIFTSLIMLLVSDVHAAVVIPEKVRVGLYFKDTSRFTDTAVSNFSISAAKGLVIGYYKDKTFIPLVEEASPGKINIKKDDVGSYHVQLVGNLSDYINVIEKINEYKEKGIVAYPAFTDAWQIWTGFYKDAVDAEKDIKNVIEQKLGSLEYKVVEPSSEKIVITDVNNKVMLLYGNTEGFLQIHPRAENNPYIFNIDNTTYRGIIEVRRSQLSDMTVINELPLEEYLYGVVPYEIGASSPAEALKAQAVSARTYTLNSLGKFSKLGFDVCTTTACQVYRGNLGETQNTNKAVDETRGKIVTYEGKPAQVFYFSSSGGHTENVKNVWGSEIPYLKGVPDKFESGKSRYYNWESVYPANELKNAMTSMGKDIGDILSMKVTKVSDVGRAIELTIEGTKGTNVLLREKCRFDLSFLRSQWYNITNDADVKIVSGNKKVVKQQLGGLKVMTSSGIKEIKKAKNYNIKVLGANNVEYSVPSVPTQYVFTGKGWGHAVGMSQEGAKGLALEGYKYDSILTHYYPGTKVE